MPPLLIVAAVAAVAAAGVAAAGQIQQGKAIKKASDFNARQAELEAQRAKEVAAFEEQRSREASRRFAGAQRASYARQGIELGEGSPLLALTETAEQAELDGLAIRYAGNAKAARSLAEASLQRFQGKQAVKASYFQAGATVLTGISRAASIGAGAGGAGGGSPAAGMSAGIPSSYHSTEI